LTICRFTRILKETQHLRVFASMPHLSFRNFCLVAATFIVALQMAAGGTPAAHAGCGDYVHVGKAESAAAAFRHSDGPSYLLGQREHLPPPSPCHGPSCRQRPMTPAGPAPVSLSNGREQKAFLTGPAASLVVSPHPLPPDAVVAIDESPAGRIERPPRHSS
jgi:hypothetical protein